MTAALLVMAQSAQAADLSDLPILRGPLTDGLSRTNWQGYYIGAQAGTGQSDMNFTGATRDITAHLLANTAMENTASVSSWPLLGKSSQTGNAYGGFFGYNGQWDDVVVGVEANYMHGKFGGAQTDSMARSFNVNTVRDDVTYQASAAMAISDMGTLRARAGYAFGSFLPYLFGGAAFGLADISRTAVISGYQGGVAFQDLVGTSVQSQHLLYGYTAGLGFDVNLCAGLFLRGEWEYLRFTASVDTQINTVRGGLGYKF
jgi:opacity protein-like surface antigen